MIFGVIVIIIGNIVRFIYNLLIPIMMITLGIIAKNGVAERINAFKGYRTKRSMKNINTWRFANKYCGTLLVKFGIYIFIVSAIFTGISLLFERGVQGMVGSILIIIQIAIIVISMFLVEKALKSKFDESGHYK